jgi:cysteinyl-tRNA synthetase
MLKIYNTATRQKEEFRPLNPPIVTMYTCGITLRGTPHIGNLRTFTSADIMRRGLEYLGYKVRHVSNFTDVGHMTLTDEQKKALQGTQDTFETDEGVDRVQKAAEKLGKDIREAIDYFKEIALKQYSQMNFLEPESRPLATEYITEQIELIKQLIDTGHAYVTKSAVYFDTSKDEDYGKLAGQKKDDKIIGVRGEVKVDPEKKHPADFRLWQLDQPDHAQQWPSPWGNGFPGWHIECSAMAMSILGETIDIHTGGRDLVTPHHENEITQSECATGKTFVNYWNHTEFLQVDGRKMSASLGNFYDLNNVLDKGFDPMDLRYFYLTANFNVQQNFTWEALDAAKNARKKLIDLVKEFKSHIEDSPIDDLKVENYKQEFIDAIEDSFNTPAALAVLWNAISDKAVTSHEKLHLIIDFDKFFGLKLDEVTGHEEINEETRKKLDKIILARNESKSNKDFSTSDKLREDAKALGFELLDTKDGTIYKKVG